MSVYFIMSYDINDVEAHGRYIHAADPLIAEHGGEILVAGGEANTVEGEGNMINVVVRFDSESSAMGFYNDPKYQPIKLIRHNATNNTTMVLADKFTGIG